jgi:hypothetical protein
LASGHTKDVLAQQPALAALIRKMKAVEGFSSDSELVAGIKSHHVTEYSLESYCVLIRFMYCGVIDLNVDLNDFAIGFPLNKPFPLSCKNRPDIGLFTCSTSSTYTKAEGPAESDQPVEPGMLTTWSEVFQVADCYQVTELRDYCRDKIISSLEPANALEALFGYAHRYEDMRDKVLDVVVKNLSEFYMSDTDPLEPYADHPQRYKLMTEALRYKSRSIHH